MLLLTKNGAMQIETRSTASCCVLMNTNAFKRDEEEATVMY